MRKNVYALALLVCMLLPITIMAAPRTKAKAMAIAQERLGKRKVVMAERAKVKKDETKPELALNEDATFYAFNSEDKGFVVISGDDRMPEVIAYSDEGRLDMDNLPPAAEAFFMEYEATLKNLGNAPASVMQKATANTAVAPLLGNIKFDQGAPYNNMCPTYIDAEGNAQRCVTGCVATAVVQLMTYWRYPKQLVKDIPGYNVYLYVPDYRKPTTKATIKLPTIPKEQCVYDYNKILPTYGKVNYTAQQANEIAKMMYHVGSILQMSYGPSSGTTVKRSHLVYSLGFDNEDVEEVNRLWVSHSDWIDLIKKELLQKRPVLMEGKTSKNGGHEFVCDGMDTNGFFHINWGWGGSSDGYFDLDILNPHNNTAYGADSALDGFSCSNSMIIGIHPDDGIVPGPAEIKNTDFEIRRVCSFGKSGANLSVSNSLYKISSGSTSIAVAFGYLDENNRVVKCSTSENRTSSNVSGLYSTGTVMASYFQEGKIYKIGMIVSLDKGVTWKMANNYYKFGLQIEKYQGVLREYRKDRVLEHDAAVLSWTDLKAVNYISNNVLSTIKVTVKNTGGEYYNQIKLYYNTVNTFPTGISQYSLGTTIPENGQKTFEMSFTPKKEGLAYLWLTNATGKIIGTKTINVTAQPKLSVYSVTSSATTDIDPSTGCNIAYSEKTTIKYVIKNTGGPFYGPISVLKFDNSDGYLYDDGNVSVSIPTNGTYTISRVYTGPVGKLYGGGVRADLLPLRYHLVYLAGPKTKSNMVFTTDTGNTFKILNLGAYASVTNPVLPRMDNWTTPMNTGALKFNGLDQGIINTKFRGTNNIIFTNTKSDRDKIKSVNSFTNVAYYNSANPAGYCYECTNLQLLDKVPFSSSYGFTCDDATLVRTENTQYETICLPFDVPSTTEFANSIIKDYYVLEPDMNKTTATSFVFKRVTKMYAGKPYLIKFTGTTRTGKIDARRKTKVTSIESSTSGTNGAFVSVWKKAQKMSELSTSYDYYMVEGTATGFKVRKATSTDICQPFHAYIRLKKSTINRAPQIVIVNDDEDLATGIDGVESQEESDENTPVYNLSGQRINTAKKGIVIKDGKKVVVK